jgi:hypothetical protein
MEHLKTQILKNKKISFKRIENVSRAFFIQQVISQSLENLAYSSKK